MSRIPSVMNHNFSQVPRAEIPRSSFDRSHGLKTTFNSGYLVPVFVDEALPGDTFTLNVTAFARLATPLHPVMDNIFLNSFFFFVPYRGLESLSLRQVTVSYSLKACKTLILHAFLFLVLSHKVSICINFCYLTGYPLLDFKNG